MSDKLHQPSGSHRSAKRVGFYPGVGNNPYTLRMQSCLPENHQAVLFPRIKLLALHRLFRVLPKVDVVLVSWLENCLVDRRTGKARIFGRLTFLVKLYVLRLFSRHVIMVRHNQFPHSTRPDDQHKVKQLIDQLEQSFDAVITHSGHQTDHRYYVPHPLYYADFPQHNRSLPDPLIDGNYCVAFGRISRYKNLLALVDAWGGSNQLVIAGKADDPSYLALLTRAAKGKNVTIAARYWSDDDAYALVAGANALVLAHEGNDVVVSGSYFYAISCGTPVLALTTPFLNWLQEQHGPAITTADTVQKLVEGAAMTTPLTVDDRESIHRQGVEWFGDDVVRSRLRVLFAGLS